MLDLSFSLDLVRSLSENRTPIGTALFQFFTWVGEVEGYLVVVLSIHAAYDKKLAFRLAVLALVAMSLNHMLKTLVANPRPFVEAGSHTDRWAVSEAKAAELAPEYSTPSGHAMGGSCFYTYLSARVESWFVRAVALGTFVLMGLSRPYLGVHYLEDVLLGWAIGIPLALLALRFGERVGVVWNRFSPPQRGLILVASSLAIWLATTPYYASNVHGRPLPFVSYLGFLTGIMLAYPVEGRWIAFDPKSSTMFRKAVRTGMSVCLVTGFLLLTDLLFEILASDASILGNLLRYIRYASAGVVATLGVPFLFVRLGLAAREASA